MDKRTDRQLVHAAADGDSPAFATFYRRHIRSLLGFLMWRTGDAEVAADLAAETFAAVSRVSAPIAARLNPRRGCTRSRAESWR
jgi:RNA polymerase sigma-70 factor (ECF subfamily)